MARFGTTVFPRIRIGIGAGRYIYLGVLTTTQRDALSASAGYLIYNSTTGQVEEYNGSTWRSVGQAVLTTHAAVLDAHTKNIWELMRTGEYYLSPLITSRSSSSSVLTAANQLYAMPFPIARATTWDRIAFYVNAQAGQKVRLGIYNNGTNLTPGTLLLDAGEVTLSGTGQQEITISQALVKGLYWVALVSDGTPTLNDYNAVSHNFLGLHSGWSANRGQWSVAHTYGALPNPFGTAGDGGEAYRISGIALRLLTLD